jgi:hypothetical protein
MTQTYANAIPRKVEERPAAFFPLIWAENELVIPGSDRSSSPRALAFANIGCFPALAPVNAGRPSPRWLAQVLIFEQRVDDLGQLFTRSFLAREQLDLADHLFQQHLTRRNHATASLLGLAQQG